MKGKLFLAGGGGKEQSKVIDSFFAKEVQSILYIPNAINTQKHPYDSCLNFVQSCLPNTKITMIYELSELEFLNLSDFEGVYIGGGDTAKLLYQLKSINFLEKLNQFRSRGGHIYGGSAGAIILGKSIDSSEKGKVKLPVDSIAANFFEGVIWPHYVPEDDDLIFSLNCLVYAIPENGGLIFGDSILAIGECYTFRDKVKQKLN